MATNQDDQKLVRFTLDMEEEFHREFKMCAVSQGVSMRELALQFIREGIDRVNQTAKTKTPPLN